MSDWAKSKVYGSDKPRTHIIQILHWNKLIVLFQSNNNACVQHINVLAAHAKRCDLYIVLWCSCLKSVVTILCATAFAHCLQWMQQRMDVCRDINVGSSFWLISDVHLGSLDNRISIKRYTYNWTIICLDHCSCLDGLMSARTGVCRYPRLHGWKSVGMEASDLRLGSFQMSSWGHSTTEQP